MTTVFLNQVTETMKSALIKLKGGMDDGPFAPDVPLTTSECTVIYRLLVELQVIEKDPAK